MGSQNYTSKILFFKSRLKSGNACYHSVQNLLSSSLLSKNKKNVYRTIILPVVLYGSETWSLTLKKEYRQKTLENGMLKDKVTSDWRRLHNEELYDLYCSPTIIRVIKSSRMIWAEHVASVGETSDADRILTGKT